MATTLVPVKNYPFLLNGKFVADGDRKLVRAASDVFWATYVLDKAMSLHRGLVPS